MVRRGCRWREWDVLVTIGKGRILECRFATPLDQLLRTVMWDQGVEPVSPVSRVLRNGREVDQLLAAPAQPTSLLLAGARERGDPASQGVCEGGRLNVAFPR
jgi:hypothetical protein